MARILLDAIRSGNVSLAKEIIESESYGCVDSQTSRRDGTSLFFCCSRGYLELAVLLLKKSANMNARNKCLATPLHAAADNNHLKIVSLLLDHGAEINVQTHRGDTPLHLAAFRGHADVVQCLVDHGADFLLPNESNMTPAVEALSRGHMEVGQYLNAVQDLYGPPSSSRAKRCTNRTVRLDPPSVMPLPPLYPSSQSSSTSSCKSAAATHRHAKVLEPSRHESSNSTLVSSFHMPQRPAQSSSFHLPQRPAQSPKDTNSPRPASNNNDMRDAMNDYLFHNWNNDLISHNSRNSLVLPNNVSKTCPSDNGHPSESPRPVPGSRNQHQQHSQSAFFSKMHRCEQLSLPREPEESIDYSLMYSPPPATVFPSTKTLPKTNDILTTNESISLSKDISSCSLLPRESDERIDAIRIASNNDKHSVLSSGSDGSSGSCYGDVIRDDFDSMNSIFYPPGHVDSQVGISNDYAMLPASSLRHNLPITYNRLPSTPSSIELSDPFDSTNHRSTSPMSVELLSSDSKPRSMETSTKDTCRANDTVNDLLFSSGLPCRDVVTKSFQSDHHLHAPPKKSVNDTDSPSSNFISIADGMSMNDLSSVTSRPASLNFTVVNIPLGNTKTW